MTPKEKSIELVNKFLRYVPAEEEYEFPYAKQCALIAVDEILHALEYKPTHNHEELYFYEQVKQEIEKL